MEILRYHLSFVFRSAIASVPIEAGLALDFDAFRERLLVIMW